MVTFSDRALQVMLPSESLWSGEDQKNIETINVVR